MKPGRGRPAPRLLASGGENRQHFLQSPLEGKQIGSICTPGLSKGQGGLRAIALSFRFEELPGAVDGVALFVQKLLHAHDILDIFASIQSLAGIALGRLELRKFCFPKAENVGRQRAKLRDFADAKEELVGNHDLGSRFHRARSCGSLCSHVRIVCRLRTKVNYK